MADVSSVRPSFIFSRSTNYKLTNECFTAHADAVYPVLIRAGCTPSLMIETLVPIVIDDPQGE